MLFSLFFLPPFFLLLAWKLATRARYNYCICIDQMFTPFPAASCTPLDAACARALLVHRVRTLCL